MPLNRRLVLGGCTASVLATSIGAAQDSDVEGALWKIIIGNQSAFDEGAVNAK